MSVFLLNLSMNGSQPHDLGQKSEYLHKPLPFNIDTWILSSGIELGTAVKEISKNAVVPEIAEPIDVKSSTDI